jgi:hypothetical protein
MDASGFSSAPKPYLASTDFGDDARCDGTVFTVKGCQEENLYADKPGQNEPYMVMYFTASEKGLRMNPTNTKAMREIFGTYDTDAWVGNQVEVYMVDTTTGAGEACRGLRVRKVFNPGKEEPQQGQQGQQDIPEHNDKPAF